MNFRFQRCILQVGRSHLQNHVARSNHKLVPYVCLNRGDDADYDDFSVVSYTILGPTCNTA